MDTVDTGQIESRVAWVAMWTLLTAALVNAVLHVRAVCWSLIASDNWNHIHPLLADAQAGRLHIGNFLIQRAGVDHAQPLNKLVMLVNARWFGLDFRLEGYLGMAFGAAAIVVLWRMVCADAVDAHGVAVRPQRPAGFHLAFAAAAAVLLSLNTSFIYTYSMVTMWFALYTLTFAMLFAAWRALQGRALLPLALVTFVLGVVADDSMFLDATALALALLLYGLRTREWRRTLKVLATVVLAVLLTRVMYALFGETSGATQAVFNQPLSARISGLMLQWRDGWTWFALPATSGLVSGEPLRIAFGGHAMAARNVIGVLLLAAHAWFWWSTWRLRSSAAWLAAVMLMLMFYAHVAAVLMARVFARGTGYMEQERYVSFYQFGVIALLLMAMTWLSQRPSRRLYRVLSGAAVAVLLLQVPLTWLAKEREPGIDAHNRHMAMSMAQVIRDPQQPPADCASGMDLCVLPLARRIQLIGVLRAQQLSLFSPQFARRHPEDAAAVALAKGQP